MAGDGSIEAGMSHSLFFRLSDASHAAPVSSLRLDAVTAELADAGLNTLGALLSRIEIEPRGIRGIPGLDRTAALNISQRLEALAAFVDDEGNIDWEGFDPESGAVPPVSAIAPQVSQEPAVQPPASDDASGTEPVPSRKVKDGHGFIDSFPEVIDAIIRSRKHEADRLILTERLARQPHERKTLEQVAAAAPGSLTRERIRQRERKILEQLAEALLYGRPARLGIAFRSSFTSYWRQAAEWFGQKDEVTFTTFMEGLQEAWNVPADRLFVHLPLIMSVLTSRATIPERMRNQMKLDPRVYRKLDDEARRIPLTKLATGKSTDKILEYGVETVGDLFDLVRAGRGPDPWTRAGKDITQAVAGLTDALAEDGSIDWSRYAQAMGLVRLPANDPSSAAQFLQNLADDIEVIIGTNAMPVRAVQIFRMRIAVPRASRLTLAEAAALLNTHGPGIKRVESLLLATLNDHLIDRDFTRSRAMYEPRFLDYWTDAALMHHACGGDFTMFCALVSERWEVSRQQVDGSAEIMWAVLNEYPGGRPAMKRTRPEHLLPENVQRSPEGVIVLRGFRRVH